MSRSLRFALPLTCFALAACAEDADNADLGVAEIALASVPAGVECIHVDVRSGDAVTGMSFSVTPDSGPVTLALGALPTGLVELSGTAHDWPCPDPYNPPPVVPSWIAEPIVTDLVPGLPSALAFEFRRNQPGSGTADFQASAIDIAPGGSLTLGLVADGTLRDWGTQMWWGLPMIHKTPHPGGYGLTDLVGVAAAAGRGCAWSPSTLWCWGSNASGQLGNGTYAASSAPVLVQAEWNGLGIVDVQMSDTATCLVDGLGRPYCWGQNSHGEIGVPTTSAQQVTTPNRMLYQTYDRITVGSHFACGVTPTGTVECWGSNGYGQLGNFASGMTTSSFPIVVNVRGAIDVAAGVGHACAVRADGTVWCWGRNSSGELGNGTTTASPAPVQVTGIGNAVAVAVGTDASCALRSDGTAACWGNNLMGQLGDGSATSSTRPVVPRDLVGAVTLRAAHNGTTFCASLSDGEGRCWGTGTSAQIGDGHQTTRFVPTKVDF